MDFLFFYILGLKWISICKNDDIAYRIDIKEGYFSHFNKSMRHFEIFKVK